MIADAGVDQNDVVCCANDVALDAENNPSHRIKIFWLQPGSVFRQDLLCQPGEEFQAVEEWSLLLDDSIDCDFAEVSVI